MGKYRYSLRYALGEHTDERNIEALIDFCLKARIDEVMFIVGFTGFRDIKYIAQHAQDVLRVKPRLNALGIDVALNPLITIGQSDSYPTDIAQTFRHMTDGTGVSNEVCACPYCDNWRRYIAQQFQYLADTVKPTRLYLEDDLRLHNHPPLPWGGCFCDYHMQLYRDSAGKDFTREDFYTRVLQGDKTCREAYVDVASRTMTDTAQFFASVLDGYNIKLGLMTNDARRSTMEARDYKAVFGELSKACPDGALPPNRIHLTTYEQCSPQLFMWNYAASGMLSHAYSQHICDAELEIENSPRSVFSKSADFSRYQMECAHNMLPSGATFWIFSHETGMADEPEKQMYEKMLSGVKPFLEFSGGELEGTVREGVHVLVNPLSVRYNTSYNTWGNLNDLFPDDDWWAPVLTMMGLPVKYWPESPAMLKGEVVAVSGQYFKSMSADGIRELLENNYVLLEGGAVSQLCTMGLGYLIGAKDCRVIASGEAKKIVREKILEGSSAQKNGWIDRVNVGYPIIDAPISMSDRKEYTDFRDDNGDKLLSGVVGAGNVLVVPFVGGTSLSYNVRFVTALRTAAISHALSDKFGIEYIVNNGVACTKYSDGEYDYFYLTQFSDDDSTDIRLVSPNQYTAFYIADRLSPQWTEAGYTHQINTYNMDIKVRRLSSLLLKAKKAKKQYNQRISYE